MPNYVQYYDDKKDKHMSHEISCAYLPEVDTGYGRDKEDALEAYRQMLLVYKGQLHQRILFVEELVNDIICGEVITRERQE